MGGNDVPGRTVDTQGLEILGTSTCLELVTKEYVGRLALAPGSRPTIRPVNFVLDGRDPVFQTAPGTILSQAEQGAMAAFEVDGVDELYRTGWSVVVEGTLESVTADRERQRLSRLPLRPWANRIARPHWVRLRSETINGRRIV